jgi:hypothetical protein
MKLNIELDITPQEARQVLGLPDLEPMQGAVLARIEKRILDASDMLSVEGLLRTWLSLVPIGSEQYLKTLNRFFRTASTKEKSPT